MNIHYVFFQIPNPNSYDPQDWGVFSNTPEKILFHEVFGDAKECGIRFNCVKPTIQGQWQCKGVGPPTFLEPPTEIKDFLIDVKPITTTSTTTTATTTQGLKPHSNCTEKSVSFTDSSAKQMKTNKIAIISLSATCGILLVVVVITTICCTKKRLCKNQKVTINEPKKECVWPHVSQICKRVEKCHISSTNHLKRKITFNQK